MIKTPLSTVIGGAFWTQGATIIGSTSATLNQLIKSLFSDGTQGIYLNAQNALSVSDLSSIKDLSGNNNHALQANSTSRASLITDPSGYKSLKFDGIDDGYVTQSINFTNTDKVTVIAAVKQTSSSEVGSLIELSAVISNKGAFALQAPNLLDAGGGSEGFRVFGEAAPVVNAVTQKHAYPQSYLLRCTTDMTNNFVAIAKNNVEMHRQVGQLIPSSFGNYPLYLGRRGGTSLPFNGQIYALLVIGKLLDDATTAKIEKEFAKYIGVTL